MGLRFFADHCVPTSLAAALRAGGHEVMRLTDVLPKTAHDPDVIAVAQNRGSLLLSLNGDFSDIVLYPPALYRGIIAVQLHNHPEIIPILAERFLAYCAAHPDMAHYRGKLFIVEVHRIRIRI